MVDTQVPVYAKDYAGKIFHTRHSEYSISDDGRFIGRPSIEGAKIKYIAGIERELMDEFIFCLDPNHPELREKLDELILRHGQKIKPGLLLVASLTEESSREKSRNGIITSRVQEICRKEDYSH